VPIDRYVDPHAAAGDDVSCCVKHGHTVTWFRFWCCRYAGFDEYLIRAAVRRE
jgi:hypothetical protein